MKKGILAFLFVLSTSAFANDEVNLEIIDANNLASAVVHPATTIMLAEGGSPFMPNPGVGPVLPPVGPACNCGPGTGEVLAPTNVLEGFNN